MIRNKKVLLKFIFVLALLAVIAYTFRGSWKDIWAQLMRTSPRVLLLLTGTTVVYHLFEAWITYSFAKNYQPEFRFRSALYCAFFCSFYRVSTLGSGAGVAAVVCLGRRGVDYSEATGLYMLQYMFHKVSIALFSGVFFLANLSVMLQHYRRYGVYLLAAYVLTVLLSVGLVLLAAYPKLHLLILYLAGKANRSGKWDAQIAKLKESLQLMEASSATLLKNPKTVTACLGKTLLKLGFWYCIPFLVVSQTGGITLLSSWSVTSLAVMSAAVIPTPAGIGSVELVMTGLFSKLVDVQTAVAITLLYRITTFLFPCLLGGVLILVENLILRKRH